MLVTQFSLSENILKMFRLKTVPTPMVYQH